MMAGGGGCWGPPLCPHTTPPSPQYPQETSLPVPVAPSLSWCQGLLRSPAENPRGLVTLLTDHTRCGSLSVTSITQFAIYTIAILPSPPSCAPAIPLTSSPVPLSSPELQWPSFCTWTNPVPTAGPLHMWFLPWKGLSPDLQEADFGSGAPLKRGYSYYLPPAAPHH